MKLPAWWPKAALIAAGLFLWWRHDVGQREQGALNERIHARELTIAALATQHRTDTLRLVTTRHTTDSILTTDTLIRVEVVTKIVERERLACDALVGTCEKEKQALRDQIADIKKQRQGFRVFGVPLGCAAGLAGNPRGVGVGAACGVRF